MTDDPYRAPEEQDSDPQPKRKIPKPVRVVLFVIFGLFALRLLSALLGLG